MGSYRQRFLYDLTTLVTFLTGEARVHSYHLMTGSCSLVTEDVEECAPTGVHDALGQMMVLDHVGDLKVFYRNTLIAFSIGFRRLEMVITALAIHLEMGLCHVLRSLTAAMTALLASAQLALLASQDSLRGAIETRVLNGMTLAVSEKGRETNVNADVRMLTRGGKVFRLRFRFADDEGIPMPIRTQDQVDRFRRPLNGPMPLDLEAMPDLLGHDEVFLLLVHIDIFPILPQLDGMPLVAFLEAREAHLYSKLFAGKKAFERLGEAICKTLHRGGRDMLPATAFETSGEIILAWKCTLLLILSLDGLKHLVIELARLDQATHEQMGLCCIGIQAVFKRSHGYILGNLIKCVNTHVFPSADGRRFTPMSEARGSHAAFLVVFSIMIPQIVFVS